MLLRLSVNHRQPEVAMLFRAFVAECQDARAGGTPRHHGRSFAVSRSAQLDVS